jgi:1-acyl-sn-glycerol-3-phosphate acyltransferase
MQKLSPDNSRYQSPSGNSSLVSRTLPSLSFYIKFLWEITCSAAKAKRGDYDSETWQGSSIRVLRALESTGIMVEVEGLEHIMAVEGPVIFIGNHLSVMETVVLPSLILGYKPFTYVIKQSLLEVPIFKHVMASIEPIAVTRTNPRQDLKTVLDEGMQRLARGLSLVIFPQTTRAPFNPEQFSTIGVKLARKTAVPVIPLALLTDAWYNGKLIKDFGRIDPSRKVHFAFGEAFNVDGKGSTEHQQVIDFIQHHLAQWQQERQ